MKYISLIFFIMIISLNAQDSYGRLLLYGNCITCHHETKNISAPSLKVIKDRYKDVFKNEKEFVEYMSLWVLKPDEKTSIMQDMIDKYGLMPELGYDLDTLKKISKYIYNLK